MFVFLVSKSERPISNIVKPQLSYLLSSYCKLCTEAPCPFISNTSLKWSLFPSQGSSGYSYSSIFSCSRANLRHSHLPDLFLPTCTVPIPSRVPCGGSEGGSPWIWSLWIKPCSENTCLSTSEGGTDPCHGDGECVLGTTSSDTAKGWFCCLQALPKAKPESSEKPDLKPSCNSPAAS